MYFEYLLQKERAYVFGYLFAAVVIQIWALNIKRYRWAFAIFLRTSANSFSWAGNFHKQAWIIGFFLSVDVFSEFVVYVTYRMMLI